MLGVLPSAFEKVFRRMHDWKWRYGQRIGVHERDLRS